jgi:apolipoprotein N-acyltransferase
VRTVGSERLVFNSALLVDADGRIRSGYDKNLLVPFAETVPLAVLAPLFPHAQGFGAASGAPPLVLGPWRLATPICFEAIDPAFVRRMAAEARPHAFVSLANDGWFGDSQEPAIHLAVASLRAVEHRRSMVRATNSGVSAVVDPLGRVVARSPLLARDTLVASVPLLDGAPTLYGRAGDWPGALAAGAVALLGLPRRSRPSAP